MIWVVAAKAGPIGLDAHDLSMSSRIGSPARAVRDDNRMHQQNQMDNP